VHLSPGVGRMATVGCNAAEAMVEIGQRADRDRVGLEEAARLILAEGSDAPSFGICMSSAMLPPDCADEGGSDPPFTVSAGGGDVAPLGTLGVGR
jgi:hypothetical protein